MNFMKPPPRSPTSDLPSSYQFYLQAMLKLDPQICLHKTPAPTSTLIQCHDEAKSGTALFPLLSFFHTEIAYDSFTARRESLVGATMVNF
uniref:Uncharacterized protein n=1 Tax=Brassica campestris TaxID=3711 RepID=A0A3P5YNQ2_BRACM|nr:unnamed protein product [Brassica rapa]